MQDTILIIGFPADRPQTPVPGCILGSNLT
jgi:hypothetical protein